jgi:hypothetical protein
MIFSAEQLFSDAQSGATSPSTNVIDLGAPGTVVGGPAALVRDVGPGCPVEISISGVGAVADDTLTVNVVVADSEDLATDPVTIASEDIATVNGEAFRAALRFLPEKANKRYLGLTYAMGALGEPLVDAGIVAAKQSLPLVAGA